ncbi:tRNA (adenosine(37)-N6)-threonylcarbamoyltransferase complex dimerization subunit type 1 TsaB [Candidatus Gottesmanbacteria bacterium]|nr:tRNA (adenosine(37)-N6)-threonylcarbamoyltransferase complex dimerization subunit type 1 TsaB [Candidatus Gottesmanbacteria bacterium]
MKSVILSIDTSDRTKSVVGIEVYSKVEKLEVDTPLGSGTAVLTAIETKLTQLGLTLKDITGIRVATGPGSYTGLRVGAAIANALGWMFGIPVNSKPVGMFVSPRYTHP